MSHIDAVDMVLNIDYLCKGIYFDKLNKETVSEEAIINNYKKKMFNNSNCLNELMNNEKYKKVLNISNNC